MNTFAGKTALVTGGGSGVGADIARALASGGAEVWIGGRRQDALAEVVASAGPGQSINAAPLDVTDPDSTRAFFDAAPRPDIVMVNAGQAEGAPFAKVTQEHWDRIIAVNLTGAFLTMQEAVRRMDRDFGRIIAISSIAGLRGLAYAAPYTASKHGLVGLVRALSLEVTKTGITVNAICPGYLETDMTDRSVADIAAVSGKSEDAARDMLASVNRHNRLIRPDEVTSAALWLASDGAASVNGETITLAGGAI